MSAGNPAPAAVLLNAMDNVMPRYFASFILTFALKPDASFADINHMLQRSLDQTSEVIPILRSRIFPLAAPDGSATKGQLEARINGRRTPQVLKNDLSQTWPDYDELIETGLRQDALDGAQLVPASDVGSLWSAEGAPAFLIQANYVDGGLLLAFSFFHSVLDGMSAMLLVKLWGQNACTLQGALDPSRPTLKIDPRSHDRACLDRIWNEENRREPFCPNASPSAAQLRLLGLLPPAPSPEEEEQEEDSVHGPVVMASRIFYINAESLRALTRRCAQVPPYEDTGRVTANDAIMALLWRCTIRARALASPDEPCYAASAVTQLDTTLDGRVMIADPLPATYMGTLIYVVTTSMTVGALGTDGDDDGDDGVGLARAARQIRSAAGSVTRRQALEAYMIAGGLKDYVASLRHPFASLRGNEVCISSISSLNASELSFGHKFFLNAGRPDHVRPPLLEFGTLCRRLVVLPMQPSGGIEVLVEIPKQEMEILERDDEFHRFARVCG